MRVIAYKSFSTDAHAIRRELLARGASDVSFRGGYLWESGEVEGGFDACFAPEYPAIRAEYSAHGVPDLDGKHTAPPVLEELRSFPTSEVVTIICPGKYAREEMAEHPPEGKIIAVSETAFFFDKYDFITCNDGFIDPVHNIITDAVRIIRKSKKDTLPSCRWFDLELIGIFNALSTNLCAIQFAATMLKAKRIKLIGNDFTEGKGTETGYWPKEMADRVMSETVKTMRGLTSKGITFQHVRWDGSKTYIETYQPEATP